MLILQELISDLDVVEHSLLNINNVKPKEVILELNFPMEVLAVKCLDGFTIVLLG